MIVKEVLPECFCITYIIEDDTILIGDSTSLRIKFDTYNNGIGPQGKSIIIRSNTEKEYNTLMIKYNILQ